MKQLVPERKARIIAMPPGSICGSFYKRKDGWVSSRRSRVRKDLKGPKKEAMDPKALEEAMSNMRPEKKARIIVVTPSSRSGRFYRRRDGTIAKYKQLPRSSRSGYKRPFARKQKEAMDLKLMEEAVNHWPERIARIIALPAGSRCGEFYKRKDGTIVKYKDKRRQIIEGCQDAISDFRHTIEAGVKTISDLRLHYEQLKKEIVKLSVTLAERDHDRPLGPSWCPP